MWKLNWVSVLVPNKKKKNFFNSKKKKKEKGMVTISHHFLFVQLKRISSRKKKYNREIYK